MRPANDAWPFYAEAGGRTFSVPGPIGWTVGRAGSTETSQPKPFGQNRPGTGVGAPTGELYHRRIAVGRVDKACGVISPPWASCCWAW